MIIYIYKDRKIHIEWTIFKGTSPVTEDFDKALLKVFLIGKEKYLINATPKNGTLYIDLPEGLREGVYSIEAIWVKNKGILKDQRFNDRCISRSRKDYLFAITEYEEEATNIGEGAVLVKAKTSVATYGYDGLSAYEIAVLRGDFDGSEGEWLQWVHETIVSNVSKFINNIYLKYQDSAYKTRNSMPTDMRRKGIIISYVTNEGESVSERCVNDSQIDNNYWGLDSNWVRLDELSLSGEISVSTSGTWVINGEDTGIEAVGPKGSNGLTPWFKTIDNKLYHSYDNENWDISSDYIAAWFRFHENKLQISRDEKAWIDLTGSFTQNMHIRKYIKSIDDLPTEAEQGWIYMVGEGAPYTMYVYNEEGWVDNGQFTSLAVGVVNELGYSKTEAVSQDLLTNELRKIDERSVILSEAEYDALVESGEVKEDTFYYIYEEE